MRLRESLSAVLAFRTVPTTIVLLVVYALVFASVLVTDELPAVPKNQRGLDLDQAYYDLKQIAARPHPYNSHANDDVRAYILKRLTAVASAHAHVTIADDRVSNGSWAAGNYGVFFEGTNVLVKIDGTDPVPGGGVLFSAHYDSVSTAPGATDDGMGVASLMQLVEYFAKNRPRRTAVFNINNGEEDWLNGAYAFLEHPWANISDVFLNLEGAASGGRPMLFRATSAAPVRAFRAVRRPHANVLSADAFARGAIRSDTDYSVYIEAGMQGLDVAFYKGRSLYHTRRDAVPHTVGGRRALWAMVDAARAAGAALLEDERTHESGTTVPVYFDLFGTTLVVLALDTLFALNIVLLVGGPVVLAVLAIVRAVQQHRRQLPQNGALASGHGVWAWRGWALLWLHGRFWLAIIAGAGVQALLIFAFVKINPYIVYSAPGLVVIATLTTAYLTVTLVLAIPVSGSPEAAKNAAALQLYAFTWAALLGSTILVGQAQVGGVYWVTAWNLVALIAASLGLAEDVLVGPAPEDVPQRHVAGVLYEPPESEGEEGTEVETAPTEITPLIRQQAATKSTAGGSIGWWIAQLLIVVPLPVILAAHLFVILAGAMPQTLADGSSAVVVYGAFSFFSLLLVIPAAPFLGRASRLTLYAAALLLLLSLITTWTAFPFTPAAPLKVVFQQKIEVDSAGTIVRAETSLAGLRAHIGDVVAALPSSRGKEVHCGASGRTGLTSCVWAGGPLPVLGGAGDSDAGAWLAANVTRPAARVVRVSVRGADSRACRVYLDGAPAERWRAPLGDDTGEGGKWVDAPGGGVREVRLWTRTWAGTHGVELVLGPGAVRGRVACGWAEFASGGGRAALPAVEEALAFVPAWVEVTKAADALVEVWAPFELGDE